MTNAIDQRVIQEMDACIAQLRQALAEAEGKLKRYTQVSEAGNSAGDELDRIVDLEAKLAEAERQREVWERDRKSADSLVKLLGQSRQETLDAKAQLSTAQAEVKRLSDAVQVQGSDLSRLKREAAEAQADAERYRWLKKNRDVMLLTSFFGNGCVNRQIEEVEAAIDAALSTHPRTVGSSVEVVEAAIAAGRRAQHAADVKLLEATSTVQSSRVGYDVYQAMADLLRAHPPAISPVPEEIVSFDQFCHSTLMMQSYVLDHGFTGPDRFHLGYEAYLLNRIQWFQRAAAAWKKRNYAKEDEITKLQSEIGVKK